MLKMHLIENMEQYLKIVNVKAREILDSRGNPTVEAEVTVRGENPKTDLIISISPPTNFCMASRVLSSSSSFGSSIGRSARTLIRSSFIVRLQIKTGQPTWTAPKKERGASEDTPLSE